MKRYIFFSVIILLLVITGRYAVKEQRDISRQVIRFHILANSDSIQDQSLKLKVRDRILADFKDKLSGSENIAQTRDILCREISAISKSAEDEIKAQGYSYPVNVYMARDYFPTKEYGDIRLPAGVYEALRVEIGEAKGKNWWCVMFPPLCYVDVTQKTIPARDKQTLKNVLDDEEYTLVTEKTPTVKIRFKVVEIWNSIKDKC